MIDFNNVVIKYGDFTAMNDLNLSIKQGEFFSFLGPSGSGKTTVLRALTGFVKVSSGDILIDGTDITHTPIEQRNIGIVFQSYALFPTMNVYENIAYGLKVRKVPKEIIKKEVYEIIKKIDLDEEHLYKKVTELSGGQQQRVAIARSLIIKPKILCLDEPLSNLDAKLRRKLRLELKDLQRNFGITTIYVTHDQEEALTLSDRIAIFDNGLLQQVGTPLEIYNKPETEFVANFIGEVNRINGQQFNELTNSKVKINPDLDVYLLINDINTKKEDSFIEIKGKIVDTEYFGFYIKNTLITSNFAKIIFYTFVSNNTKLYSVGEETSVYIDPNRVMQFSR